MSDKYSITILSFQNAVALTAFVCVCYSSASDQISEMTAQCEASNNKHTNAHKTVRITKALKTN